MRASWYCPLLLTDVRVHSSNENKGQSPTRSAIQGDTTKRNVQFGERVSIPHAKDKRRTRTKTPETNHTILETEKKNLV